MGERVVGQDESARIIGPNVDPPRAAQAHKLSILRGRELDVLGLVPRMRGGYRMLVSALDPPHRPPNFASDALGVVMRRPGCGGTWESWPEKPDVRRQRR